MKILPFLSLLLGTLLAVAFGNNLKDGLPQPLKFQHTRFTFPIKETHGIGFTRMLLTAHGCGDKGITYRIQEKDLPFFINPHTGRISLNKRLNYTETMQYSFIVEAVAKNKRCKNAKALTLVIVNVLQFNRYRPQFEASKYYCSIQEETGHVKILPEIKVLDRDTGKAGKITQVQVWETEEPFVLELDETTGVVTVSGTPGYKFDATRMPSYKFSLQAWDGGDPPRNSPPLKLTCKVIPQNRHAPVFKEKMYVGRVRQGEVKSNIVKVEAKDGDTFERFGDICEYFIRTSDMPFEINNKGVISLTTPLGNDAPDTYVFTVMAKDCGGRITEEATTVNVIVDKDCTPGFVELENKTPELKDCDGMVRITPNIRLNMCGESRRYANFTTRIDMETTHILKGCDRETYEASGVFKMCNVNKTLDLLPSNYRENTWIAGMMSDENIIGKNVYRFDNKTAIDVPFSLMEQYTGDEYMTISLWVWMKRQDRTQYILAATDPQRLDRKHFGLYTEGDKLVFIHRREATASSEDVCKSVFVWEPKIFNTQWHHILVTVNGCQSAKLFVDSKKVAMCNVKENWPLHGTNMAKRVVIGARWLGREQRYEDYLDAYLAGLSVNFGEHIDKKVINCVYECKEQIKIDTPAPSGFQMTQIDHRVIEITGQGSPTALENILRSLVYVNTRRSPTIGRRPVQIQTTINDQPLPMLNLEIVVSTSEKTLTLSGRSRKVVALNDLKKYGIRIFEKLTITSDKCTKYLDSARVEVDPPLGSDESLVNPGPMLDLFNLRKDNLPGGKGMVIRGLATLEDYKMVIREIVFVHLGLEELNNPTTVVYHKFKITVSNLQNRYVSNTLQTELTTDKTRPQYDKQAVDRPEQDSLPGEVDTPTDEPDPDGKKSDNSFSVTIGVTIAASCVFVFVILVVVIRLQSSRNVYLDVSQKVEETAVQDKSDEPKQLNVTLNPLEKFETVKGKAGSQVTSNQPGGKTLEWDDAYIA